MKAIIQLPLLFLVFSNSLQAQLNYNRQDFDKINSAYTKYANLSMELTYNLYANYTTGTVSAV